MHISNLVTYCTQKHSQIWSMGGLNIRAFRHLGGSLIIPPPSLPALLFPSSIWLCISESEKKEVGSEKTVTVGKVGKPTFVVSPAMF